MERLLALEMIRVTEAAAIASARLMGRGDTTKADRVRRARHVRDLEGLDPPLTAVRRTVPNAAAAVSGNRGPSRCVGCQWRGKEVTPAQVGSTTDPDGLVEHRGIRGRVDLSCGRLTTWAGDVQPSGPAPPASPGTPGDCAPQGSRSKTLNERQRRDPVGHAQPRCGVPIIRGRVGPRRILSW